MTTLLSPSSEGFGEQIGALNNAIANPPPRAKMFGRTDLAHIADMTFQARRTWMGNASGAS
jgi:hypothetical protein